MLRNTTPPENTADSLDAAQIVGVEVNNGTSNSQIDINGDTLTAQIRAVTKDDHILGNLNAKVIIVEYSDTECPFCKVFHATLAKIVSQYTGKVAWVYRHYPIAQLHQKAFHEAEATECAWDQGGNSAFWKYTNELYKRTGSNDALPVEELPKIAKAVGLNVATFNTCLDSGKFAAKINADIVDGQLNGVKGTPSSFILVDGKVVDTIDGAQPFEGVKQKIDALLN